MENNDELNIMTNMFFVVIMVLMMQGLLQKPAPQPPTPPSPPAGKVNLYGRVTNKNTGSRLSGVTVILNDLTASTDNNGDYLFSDVSPGDYTTKFTKDGYEELSAAISLVEGNNLLNAELLPLPTDLANLHVVVTNSVTGALVAGAEARVLDGTAIRWAITQADGSCLISGLPVGDTIWACLKYGYVTITDTPITLVKGNNELNIELVPIGPVIISKLEVRLGAGGYTESKITVVNNLGRSIPAYDPTWGAATRLLAVGVVPGLEEPSPWGPIPFIVYLVTHYAVEIPMGTEVFQKVSDSPTTAPEGSYCKAFVAVDGVYRYSSQGFEGYLRTTWQTWQPNGLTEFPSVPGPEVPPIL